MKSDQAKTKAELIQELQAIRKDINAEDIIERKQAEERTSRYNRILESSLNEIYIFNAETLYFTDVNLGARENLGYTIKELRKMTPLDIKPLFTAASFAELVEPLHAGVEEKIQFTTIHGRKNGSQYPVEVHLQLISDSKPLFVAIIIDITKRKQAEEELRLHSEIMENMREGVYLVGLEDVTIKYTNPKFENMFGYGPGEMLGKHASIVNAPTGMDPRDTAKAIMDVIYETGEWHGEVNIIKKDGTTFWCYANVSILDHSKFGKVIVAVHTDTTKRKQVEETLRESEERYRTLVESTRDGVVITDSEGKFLFVNSSYATMLGYSSPHELIGTSAIDRYANPEERADIFKQLAKDGFADNMELELLNKDGASIYVLFSVIVKKDKSGKIIQTEAFISDITERKQVEKELKKNKEKYQQLFNEAPIGYHEIDHKGRIVNVNDTELEMLGYTADEMLGKYICQFVVDSKLSKQAVTAKLAGTKPPGKAFERLFLRKDGTGIPVLVEDRQITDEKGNITGLRTTIQDITDLKQTEKILKESENRFKQIAENSQEWIWEVDQNGLYTYASPVLENLLGYKPADIIGKKHFFDFFLPDERADLKNAAIKVFEQKQPFKEFINRNVTKKGEIVWLCTNGVPILDSNKILLGYRGADINITERKQAEKELTKQQYYLTKAQDLGSIGTWELDLLKNELIWTDQNYINFGVLLGTPLTYEIFLDCIHPDDRAYVNTEWMAAIDGKPYDIEHRLIVDDKVRWVREKADVEFDKDGKAIKAIGFTQDITERKQAENNLRDAEANLKTTFDISPGLICTANANTGYIIECNPAVTALIGISREEFTSKPFMEFIHPDDRQSTVDEMTKQLKGSPVANFENRYRCKDGSYKWLAWQATAADKNGKVYAVATDITERKQAEDALRESEEKYRTFVDTATDLMNITDKDGQITDVNRAVVDILGYSRKELKKMHISRLLTEEALKNDFEPNWRKFIDEGKFKIETTFRTKSGNEIPGELKAIANYDSSGNLIGTRAVFSDLTDRKRASAKLESALNEARKANKVKDLFLSNMSHEIRTPLNAILGFSQIIEESFKGRMQESEGEYFKVINSSGQRLIRTVHEVLDISRIEAGVLPYNPEVVRLATPIESVCNEFRPAAAAKKLEFTYASQVDDGTAKVDKSSVVKAVSNLVDNAIKYTKEGQINIQLNKQNGKYVLSISDTGIGIGEDYLGQIYDAFSQESTGYNKKYQGLGLGLSITKSCLDMNGIPITVESKQGVGTTFSLTFTPADTAIAEPETKTKQVDTKTEKTVSKVKPVVLLVEDEPHNRRALEVTLKDKYETPYAVSVTEAKQQLRKHKVDLIILDLSLEGDEDGLDLVAYMKAKKKLKDIPVIAVTAHAFPRDRDNVFNAGCDDYMSKPIVIKELLGMVSKYLK